MRSIVSMLDIPLINRILRSLLLFIAAATPSGMLFAQNLALENNLYYTGQIIPRPQNVEYGIVFSLSEQRKPVSIEILTAKDRSSLAEGIVSEMKESLRRLGLQHVKDAVLREDGSLLFSANDLLIQFHDAENSGIRDTLTPDDFLLYDQEPIPAEGYRLVIKKGKPSSVFIRGADERGLFYGIQSLKQMFFFDSNQLHAREVYVFDYPLYRDRASGNDENTPGLRVSLAAVEYLSFLKMTGWAVGQSYWWPPNWRKTPQTYIDSLKGAAGKAGQRGFDLLYQVHPFGRATDPEKKHVIRISDEDDRKVLYDLITPMLAAGSSGIILRADDFHDLADLDLASFTDKASAHSFLINELFIKMRGAAPEARLIFCPPYYWSNEFEDEDVYFYITELCRRIDKEVDIMWTGPEVVSPKITNDDLQHFRRITGKDPLLWDNTALPGYNRFGYPYRYAFYLFQHFLTEYGSTHADSSLGIRFNFGYDGSEIKRIGNAVLADYLWNPESFDPKISLKEAMGLVAGKQAVETLLELSEYLLLAFDLQHSPAYSFSVEALPSVSKVQGLLKILESTTANQALVKEMENIWWTMYQTILQLEKIERQREVIRLNSLVSIGPASRNVKKEITGKWKVELPERDKEVSVFRFSHPFNTLGFQGSKGEVRIKLRVPQSPTGKYFLHFMADDDYYAEGEPPEAWPNYFFKELLINDSLLWSKDVVGPAEVKIVELEVTELLQGRREFDLFIRGTDRKGVYNLGVSIGFSEIFLSSISLKD